MAATVLTLFLYLILFINENSTYLVYKKLPEIDERGLNVRSHLEDPKIKSFCDKRHDYCPRNSKVVCTLRVVNDTRTYRNFPNVCVLFMSNMCDHPEAEFHIVSAGSCEEYWSSRRDLQISVDTTQIPDEKLNSTETEPKSADNSSETETPSSEHIEKEILREDKITSLYPVEYAFDDHDCPYSCPDFYKPECVTFNKANRLYFKVYSFLNHCEADRYFCKNPYELHTIPGYVESAIEASPLSWSFCGSYKYVQLSRGSEIISTIGHYGWLTGPGSYKHILAPKERIPGYG